jgi:hypothetical protein
MTALEPSVGAGVEPFFGACPRCGLRVAQRFRVYAVRHCPRCMAHHRAVVELHSTSSACGEPGHDEHPSRADLPTPAATYVSTGDLVGAHPGDRHPRLQRAIRHIEGR